MMMMMKMMMMELKTWGLQFPAMSTADKMSQSFPIYQLPIYVALIDKLRRKVIKVNVRGSHH